MPHASWCDRRVFREANHAVGDLVTTEYMSITNYIMPRRNSLTTVEEIGDDRRSSRRYGLALEVRWQLLRRKRIQDSGKGCTVDLSSGGILFDAGRTLPVGQKVFLSISWPVLLHDAARMQLTVDGRVVRSDSAGVAVQMMKHEFRTAGRMAG